jgi:hypothetical protein
MDSLEKILKEIDELKRGVDSLGPLPEETEAKQYRLQRISYPIGKKLLQLL